MATIQGDSTNNELFALTGEEFDGTNDVVLGLGGDDEIDAALAGTGNNVVGGGLGDDLLFGNQGDSLFGDAGNDELEANDTEDASNNRLEGGAGNDRLFAHTGDTLLGRSGNDVLFAGVGNNTLIGGRDGDLFWLVNAELPNAPNTIQDFDPDLDILGIQFEGITALIDVTIAADGNDTLISIDRTPVAILQNTDPSVINANNLIFSDTQVSATSPVESLGRLQIGDVSFLGQVTFDLGQTLNDREENATTIGGLSGITYDPERGVYYAISDDNDTSDNNNNNNARFYELTIDLSDSSLDDGDISFTDVVFLRDDAGNAFTTIAPEGIAFTEDGTVYIASEGSANDLVAPFVNQFSLSGAQLTALPIDDKFLPTDDQSSGIRHNLAFESLTLSPDGTTLYTATEEALFQDGSEATLDNGTFVRIVQYDLASQAVAQEFIYETDPIAEASTTNGFSTNGLVELLAIDDTGTLLALERSFSERDGGFGNTVKLYEVSSQEATDVQDFDGLNLDGTVAGTKSVEVAQLAEKRLIADLSDFGFSSDVLDSVEGMTWGPVLPNGQRSLILVSDDNFGESGPAETQFFALGLDLQDFTAPDDDQAPAQDQDNDGVVESGDRNRDGIDDDLQPHIINLGDTEIALSAALGLRFGQVRQILLNQINFGPNDPPRSIFAKNGQDGQFLAFNLSGFNRGQNLPLALLLPDDEEDENRNTIYKLNEATGELFEFNWNGRSGGRLFDRDGDGQVDFVLSRITDGGRGDLDGVADGVITDPVSLGTASVSDLQLQTSDNETFSFSSTTENDTVTAVNLRFNLESTSTEVENQTHEVGLVRLNADNSVTDTDGNTVALGDANFLATALDQGEVIFSSLARDQLIGTDPTRTLQLATNQRFAFYFIADGTSDAALRNNDFSNITLSINEANTDGFQPLQVSQTGGTFTLGFEDNLQNNSQNNSQETLQDDDDILSDLRLEDPFEDLIMTMTIQNGPLDLQQLIANLQGDQERELLDLRDLTGQQVNVEILTNREAVFDNFIGFYPVANETGGLDTNGDGTVDLNPGDGGYLEAVIQNRLVDISITALENQFQTINGTLAGGALYAPFLIVGATPNTVNFGSTQVHQNRVYTPYIASSADGQDHFRMLGDNIFGVEDLFGLGDADYDDVVVAMNFTAV
jgi:hypothetical protein